MTTTVPSGLPPEHTPILLLMTIPKLRPTRPLPQSSDETPTAPDEIDLAAVLPTTIFAKIDRVEAMDRAEVTEEKSEAVE